MAINVPSAARELGPLWELQLKQLAQKGQRWNQVADTIRGFGDIADAYQKSKDNKLTLEEKKGRIAEAKERRDAHAELTRILGDSTMDIPTGRVGEDNRPEKMQVPLSLLLKDPTVAANLSAALKSSTEITNAVTKLVYGGLARKGGGQPEDGAQGVNIANGLYSEKLNPPAPTDGQLKGVTTPPKQSKGVGVADSLKEASRTGRVPVLNPDDYVKRDEFGGR